MKRAISVLVGMLLFAASSLADEIDFNRDIRPILSDKCFVCHGPDESSRQADLRLDSFEYATDYAIVPGDANQSEVFLRVIEQDEDLRMPPAEHGSGLTDIEQELFRKWINEGANYDVHWSYKKPVRPAIEAVENNWFVNEIDRLTLPVMKQAGLSPADEADRYTLIRRVAFDLIGLPPEQEEVEAFVADHSNNAYETMVDKMLAKPAYGERWAAVWLDQARYADSMGYAEDRQRTIWAWRDYVIKSFNSNKPFDQFTIEQIAGDLLTNPTEEQIVATAFHRNTLTNTEGGTIDEEFRSAAVVDRTNTTMAVWMGTTMACAQCHTHKYDPLTQTEYFQFYAFFNNTADNDQPDESPVYEIYSEEQKSKQAEIREKVNLLERELNSLNALPENELEARIVKLQNEWEQSLAGSTSNKPMARFLRFELPGNNAILSLAEVEVYSGKENIARNGIASQSSTAFGGPADRAVDGNTSGALEESKSVTHTDTELNPWWEVEFDRSYVINEFVIWNRTDGKLQQRLDGVLVRLLDKDRNAVWSKTISTASREAMLIRPATIPIRIFELLSKQDRSTIDSKMLNDYFVRHHGPEHRLNGMIDQLQFELDLFQPTTSVPVLKELDSNSRRQTHVHHRGSYQDKGDLVSRSTPAVFHPIGSVNCDRLDLANWLVDKDNPLTARVTVNRLWQQLFGIGIVATGEEFGSQGDLPSHPELLDYLACEFMDSGWNMKHIIKTIVKSATYRQSSRANSTKMERDPNNRMLSRGPRFRLSAEMIRDQALACSELLSQKMFGPPVQPPQPKTGLKMAFREETADWEDSIGDDRYRRAIYTRWQRSSPYPSLTTFDVSNREVCELRRLRTNTPLQALVTLNDPVYIEAAQSLARRICILDAIEREKVSWAFKAVLIREATENEIDELVHLFNDALRHYDQDKTAAEKLGNDPLNPVGPEVNMVELAAWTTVANVLFNLDETFVKP